MTLTGSLYAKHFAAGAYNGRRPDGFLGGFPFFGGTPLVRREEAEDVGYVNNFRAEFFRLWVAADARAYATVMQHVHNRLCFVICRREIPVERSAVDGWPSEPGGSLKIYLEWTEPEAVLPHDHLPPMPVGDDTTTVLTTGGP